MRNSDSKTIPPKLSSRTAVLTLNVVDFTFLCEDATPEQITSILNKLNDMIELKLENYEKLFKVILYKMYSNFNIKSK